jgi:hypothetical protein
MISNRTRITAIPVLAAAGFAASLPFGLKALAQDASPEATPVSNPFADLGLPELMLTYTPEAIELSSSSLEAGRYVLTVTGEPTENDFAFAPFFLQLPEGTTLDDVMAQVEENPEGFPPVVYESTLTGGKGALAMMGETTAISVIDLLPGNWVAVDTSFTRAPIEFTVTGEAPADAAEPESNVTLEMGEMYFKVTDGAFVAGENIVHLFNGGVQPHFAEIMKVPDGTENANIEALITAEMGGTPEAEPLNFEDAMPVGYLAEQSEGVSSWSPLTLEAGTYALMCWVTDPETGMPHAMMGMHDVFVVE